MDSVTSLESSDGSGQKIKTGLCAFDTSIEAVKQLKTAPTCRFGDSGHSKRQAEAIRIEILAVAEYDYSSNDVVPTVVLNGTFVTRFRPFSFAGTCSVA